MTQPVDLTGATVIRVHPGDRLVFVTSRQDITRDQADAMAEFLREAFPGHEVRVIGGIEQVVVDGAALDGSSEIEWGARCIAPSHDHGDGGVYNVRTQRAAVEEFLNILDRRADYELVRRRRVTGAWERVD